MQWWHGRLGRRENWERNGEKIGLGGLLHEGLDDPTIYIRSNVIRGKIEMWKEKALIRNFVGVWPKEKDLVQWVQGMRKLKGHYDLHLGAKGLFTIIFFN